MQESREAGNSSEMIRPTVSPARGFCGLIFLLLFYLLVSPPLAAQDRPLRTADTETVPPGTLRAEVGFDFLQDQNFPLTALSGDLTSLANLNLRLGVGKIVEVQLEGAVHQFLTIKKAGTPFTTLKLSSPTSTGDVGNFSLWTKVRILGEASHHPAVAFRFGFEMPNAKQSSGVGTNTSNLFASVILQKHFGRLNLFGDVGLGILQTPLTTFSQNDVITYGAAFIYTLHRRVNLVGEFAGRHSTRRITDDLVGTEGQGQARLGFQIFAGGFQWDVAGIAGLYRTDAKTGITFGISRDIQLFRIPSDSK